MRMGVPMPVQPTPPLAGGYRATLACDPHQFVQHPLPVVVLQLPPALHREVNGAEVLGHTHQIIHVHQLEGRGGEGREEGRGREEREEGRGGNRICIYVTAFQASTRYATLRTPAGHPGATTGQPLTCIWAATGSGTTVFLNPNRPAVIMR